MKELIEKLKHMPRWAWWATGGTVLTVIAVALWARRRNTPVVAELPPVPPPAEISPGAAPAAPSGPSGGRDPDRNGDTNSWLRSALGGLLTRSATLETEVAQLRMGLAAQAGMGMGTAPNRSSVSLPGAPSKASIIAGTANDDDDGPTLMEREVSQLQGVTFSDRFTGYSNISGAVTTPGGAYDPTKDTKRVFDPVHPTESLPAPAERKTQPGPLPVAPGADLVREAFEKGQIGREQLMSNYKNAGKAIPDWLQASGGGGARGGGGGYVL